MFVTAHFYAAEKWLPPGEVAIRMMMDKAGWEIETFAGKIKATGRTVYHWLEGRSKIKYSAWCVLCEQAGVHAIWNNHTEAAARLSLKMANR